MAEISPYMGLQLDAMVEVFEGARPLAVESATMSAVRALAESAIADLEAERDRLREAIPEGSVVVEREVAKLAMVELIERSVMHWQSSTMYGERCNLCGAEAGGRCSEEQSYEEAYVTHKDACPIAKLKAALGGEV